MKAKNKEYWGFDTKSIDASMRPQDDFYNYANGGWLKSAKMPPEEARWGSFTVLRVNTEHQLKKLVETAREPMVRKMYSSALDMKVRNKLGLRPLLPLMAKITAIKGAEDLEKVLAYLHTIGLSAPWGEIVDQDSKNSSRYALHLWQGGLGMPDRDYYLLNLPEQKRVRDAYFGHIRRLTRLAGATQKEQENIAGTVLAIEMRLAKASMPKEDTRDPEKIYHKMTVRELQRISPALDWMRFLKNSGIRRPGAVIVGQPAFFREVSKMLQDVPLEDWKVYLGWHLLNGSAGLLSEPFIKENFDFYVRTLAGTKKMRAPWRRALAATNSVVGDIVGQLYVKSHFPSRAKKAMDALVSDLFAVYEKRIKELDWMGAATKRKATVKLRAMRRKIAYPKKWKSYKGLQIKAGDYFGNMLRSDMYEHRRQLTKLAGPINLEEWFMTPQTVNAYFSPNLNEIVFPAAILQWPFFDFTADAAINYAGIGSVIGHEMTHGFDDSGAKFDARGNMRNWWSKDDKRRFEKKSKVMVSQANSHKVEEGVHLNGELTLGENIADLGGLAIGWDAYQKHLKKAGRRDIAGLSPEERFFLGYAQMERELARPEVRKLAALTDPHAEASFRVNGPLSNFLPFYETYKLKKGDGLYRNPKARAEIW